MKTVIKGMIMIAERFNERLEAIGVSITNDSDIRATTAMPTTMIATRHNGVYTPLAFGSNEQCKIVVRKATASGNVGARRLLVTRIKESTNVTL
jgi:hypothetical protein